MAPEKLIQPGSKKDVAPPAEGEFSIFEENKNFKEGDGEGWKVDGGKIAGVTKGPDVKVETVTGKKIEGRGECLWCLKSGEHSDDCLTKLEERPRDEARTYWTRGRRDVKRLTEPGSENRFYLLGWQRGLKDKEQKMAEESEAQEEAVKERTKKEIGALAASIGVEIKRSATDSEKENKITRFDKIREEAVGKSPTYLKGELEKFLGELKK